MQCIARRAVLGLTASLALAIAIPAVASAATIVVTPAHPHGWSTADTRPGGAVTFVNDPTSPAPPGALQLTTDATTTAKAQYLHAANTPLSSVTRLSYYTKQVSGPPVADPSYQLITCLTGAPTATTCPGFTTFVFEPYQNLSNNGNPGIVPNVWQKWDVANGLFWSTRSVVCSNGAIVGTSGGPATYTLAAIKTMCPGAVVGGFGVNIGSNNPSYTVRTDLFRFNGNVYNFEVSGDNNGNQGNGDENGDGSGDGGGGGGGGGGSD
jgi:hypothetical protein